METKQKPKKVVHFPCVECNSTRTEVRSKTNDRHCRNCGHNEPLRKVR